MNYVDLRNEINNILGENIGDYEGDGISYDDISDEIVKLLAKYTDNYNPKIKNIEQKLGIIYENEKHYLDLIKDYKEEIKFMYTMEEELRKERTQFFSQGLKQVYDSLKEAQVDQSVSAEWIRDLVYSYTSSLDVSAELVNTEINKNLSNLKKQSSKLLKNLNTYQNEMEEVAVDE